MLYFILVLQHKEEDTSLRQNYSANFSVLQRLSLKADKMLHYLLVKRSVRSQKECCFAIFYI